MRNISFSLTTAAVRARQKTVTRRVGWRRLKPGTVLQAVEKSQGLKRGERAVKICQIRVLSTRLERLDELVNPQHPEGGLAYGVREMVLEGLPEKTPGQFIHDWVMRYRGVTFSGTVVNRIEFEYLPAEA